jgi:TadE-like protein
MKPPSTPGPFRRPGRPATRRRQGGATMVEFAIAGPVAILIILGLIQLGMMMVAKQIVNEAAFEGARMGATEHAQKNEVVAAIKRKLLPFYQNSTTKDDFSRLSAAALAEGLDIDLSLGILNGPKLTVQRLSPPDSAFKDFGTSVDNGNGGQVQAIPNDNLEYRLYDQYKGPQSGLTIQDANELRIKVVYAYELKVPLMKFVIRSVLCGFDTGVNAFGRGNLDSVVIQENVNLDCFNYYNRGRVPITSYATVQMQSDAWQDSNWN